MIQIKSKYDGFRRCGVAHTKAGHEFSDDFFTDDQIKQLKNDPMLTVVHVKAVPGPVFRPGHESKITESEPEITDPEPEKTGKKTKAKGR